MSSFDELVLSRRAWIEDVLRPWCQAATLSELRKAELEWPDLAGRADPEATLWTWAWSRFPAIVHEGLPGLNETQALRLTLRDGTTITGWPDNRRSRRGELVVITLGDGGRTAEHGPFTIDDIAGVEPALDE